VTFTDAKGLEQRAPEKLGPIGVPGNFGGHEKLNQDVGKVTELPRETLNLAEGPVSCRVLQVEYDHPDWPPEERSVRYWIDEMRLLVLKVEFSQSQRHELKTSLWHWVYEAKSVKLNQPPPDWLVEFAKRSATQKDGRQLTDRIGKNAPEFTLADLDNNSLSLSAMKGRVAVLNFWATWCARCIGEMSTITKRRATINRRVSSSGKFPLNSHQP
jgi:thiol-disulfide isomerase/thioredoxin